MIRAVTPADHPAIRQVIGHAFGRRDEADLVEQLRADGEVLVELAAARGAALVGHILYSRLLIERQSETLDAAALAPVCVLPAFQRAGIGKALIRAGDARCAELKLSAVIVLGHADYYPQFGYSAAAAESLQAPFSGPHFMALELVPGALKAGGRVRYAKAFGV